MRYLISLLFILILSSCGNEDGKQVSEPEFLMADDSTYGYVSFRAYANTISADSLVSVLDNTIEYEGTVSGEAYNANRK